MKLLSVEPSNKSKKRLVATFLKEGLKSTSKNIIKVHFGLRGGSAYPDHKNEKTKENYIKRHIVRENWANPITPGALSRYILWGELTIEDSIIEFKKRFNL